MVHKFESNLVPEQLISCFSKLSEYNALVLRNSEIHLLIGRMHTPLNKSLNVFSHATIFVSKNS